MPARRLPTCDLLRAERAAIAHVVEHKRPASRTLGKSRSLASAVASVLSAFPRITAEPLGRSVPGEQEVGALTTQISEIEALIERFLVEAELAESTKETYRRALRSLFAWKEERGITDLARGDILAYKQDMLARVRPTTASTYLTAVKRLFKWLESMKAYPNVAAGVKTMKLANMHRKDALMPAQAKRVLQVLKGDTPQAKRDFVLLNLLIRVGLRSIEVTRSNLGDLRSSGGRTILQVQGKGRIEKDALVVLTEATLGPIYDYLAARRCEGREVLSDDPLLFASLSNKTYGRPLSTRSIRQIAKEALRAAGLESERLTTHSFRHSAVTFALLGGASVRQAQALARHSNLSTTLGTYAHDLDRISQAPESFVDSFLDD